MTSNVPNTRIARQARIGELVERQPITSQSELRTLLAESGIDVTQATLSRDLEEMRAYKEYNADGLRVYRVPDPVEIAFSESGAPDHLDRWTGELMTNAVQAMNQVVVRTIPGAAQLLASAIDRAALSGVLGCIAGDDTMLIVTDSDESANAVVTKLLSIAKGKRAAVPATGTLDGDGAT